MEPIQPNPIQTPAPAQQIPSPGPVPQPQTAVPSHPKGKRTLIIAGVVILCILLGFLLYRQVTQQPSDPAAPTPTPTSTPSPTPIRELSGIAGDPAFAELEASVASLSASIRNFNAQDPSLSPPSLILPLGFPKE